MRPKVRLEAVVFYTPAAGAGLLIDHWGWFGVPVHRVSPGRVLGALLLLAGMALIRWR